MSDQQKIREIISKLRPKLQEYLVSQNVRITGNGFFSCIHPDHPDRHPSCSLNYGNPPFEGEVFHCFSRTGHDGNIFTAAHWLEGLPVHDFRFYSETLVKLCSQFGIEYSPMELSEDDKIKFMKRRALEDSLHVIQSMTYEHQEGSTNQLRVSRSPIKHLLDRGIDSTTIKAFQMGTIDAHSQYLTAMKGLGWEDEGQLQSFDLVNQGIFNRSGVIIPIFDDVGRLVGYVTRNTIYNPNDHASRKYYNSTNSDIYQKGAVLFNYNNCQNLPGPLYIVEGYLDAVYMWQSGIKKVCAIGATVLTEKHIEMLWKHGQHDILLCLDGDTGGHKGVELALERFSDYKAINVKVVEMPTNTDPDSFIREFGTERFEALPTFTPFRWMLTHNSYSESLDATVNRMIPIIAQEDSAVQRTQMIRELAHFASIDESDIRADVEKILSQENDQYLKEINDVNGFVMQQLQRKSIRDTYSILKMGIDRMDIINEKHNSKIDLKNDFQQRISMLADRIQEGDFKEGLKTPKFRRFQELVDGVPYWANLMLFGGRPSAGKTAFITALSLDVVEANPDAAVFYMSIDDSADLMLTKILAARSGLSVSEIKRYTELPKEKQERFQEALAFMRNISDRYIIVDASQGTTLDVLENHVSFFRKNFKDMKTIFMLDNFHKLSLPSRAGRFDALTEASQRIKNIALVNDMPIIATVELRKLASETDRPTRQDMSGTNKLDYDADVVALIHNDLQVNSNSLLKHDVIVDGKKKEMPFIEVNVVKNKITGELGMVPYEFNRHDMSFREFNSGKYRILRSKADNKKHSVDCTSTY